MIDKAGDPAIESTPPPPAPIAVMELAALRLLTAAEVAAALRFKSRRPDQLVRGLQERGLRVLMIGGRLRVRPIDLMAFEEQLLDEAATKAAAKAAAKIGQAPR